ADHAGSLLIYRSRRRTRRFVSAAHGASEERPRPALARSASPGGVEVDRGPDECLEFPRVDPGAFGDVDRPPCPPSTLALKRLSGSSSDAPLAKVILIFAW